VPPLTLFLRERWSTDERDAKPVEDGRQSGKGADANDGATGQAQGNLRGLRGQITHVLRRLCPILDDSASGGTPPAADICATIITL
jgi:hypothetical protein